MLFLFSSFPLLLAFVVGDLGFEFRVFVAGWRHALRSEWPFIIFIHYHVIISWLRLKQGEFPLFLSVFTLETFSGLKKAAKSINQQAQIGMFMTFYYYLHVIIIYGT